MYLNTMPECTTGIIMPRGLECLIIVGLAYTAAAHSSGIIGKWQGISLIVAAP